MRSATPFVSVGEAFVTEGNDGTRTAALTVRLSASPKKSVVVDFRTENGSATAGSDYQSVTGKLTFRQGQRSKTIFVPVFGDRLGESNESFFVRLLSVSGGRIADGIGDVTIIDDEPRILISDQSQVEGCGCFGTTPLTFSVWMAAAYDQPVTVNYATADGTATLADGDYTAAAGTITFAPGETYKTVTIDVLGDVTVEDNEVFFVRLTSAFAGAVADEEGTGLILDDDGTPPPPPDDGGYLPPGECTPDYANYPLCN